MKTLFLILAMTTSVYCQTPTATWEAPEFGEISEIARMTKVYVHCDDLKIRQRIVTELKKDSSLEVVSRIDDAEFALSYTWSGLTTWSAFGGARTNAYKGDLMVYIAGRPDKENVSHQRIVWSTQASRKTTLSKNPADKAVQQFIKDYKAASKP